MDLTPFKSDIDELINDFTQSHSTTLSDLKTLWISRKFTFIYDSSPTTNIPYFIQSLFAHSIHHILSPTSSFSQRLAGLYCLYCLHQTQPFKPPFKVYLSLVELKKLKGLVVEAKGRNVKDVAAVVKRMYEKDVFMFGAIEMNDSFVSERVNEVMDLQNARVRVGYEKLVRDVPIERVVCMDLGVEVEVKAMKKIEKEYEDSKGRATAKAGEIVDVQNVKHIAEREKLFGDVMERVVEDWNTQKDVFCRRTGFSTRRQSDEDNNGSNDAMNVEEVDEFGKELELLLFNGSV